MDITAYFRSLSLELESQRDRVRQLIGGRHWPTDGQWKESVLRAMLRRTIGDAYRVGSGFAIAGDKASTQIDLLIYRADSPVLFRDGDLVIIPAEGVSAIVEVKSRLTSASLRAGIEHLATLGKTLRQRRSSVVTGLFAYESNLANHTVLNALRSSCSEWPTQVDLLSHGPDRFVRYWQTRPGSNGATHEQWHSYEMPGLAFGYFVQNIVTHLVPAGFPTSGEPHFPARGKETFRDGAIYRRGALLEAMEHLRTD